MPEELKVGLRGGLNPEVDLAVPYQAHPSHIRMIEDSNEYILHTISSRVNSFEKTSNNNNLLHIPMTSYITKS